MPKNSTKRSAHSLRIMAAAGLCAVLAALLLMQEGAPDHAPSPVPAPAPDRAPRGLSLATAEQEVVPVPQELIGAQAAETANLTYQPGKGGKLEEIKLPAPERFTTRGGRRGWRLKNRCSARAHEARATAPAPSAGCKPQGLSKVPQLVGATIAPL